MSADRSVESVAIAHHDAGHPATAHPAVWGLRLREMAAQVADGSTCGHESRYGNVCGRRSGCRVCGRCDRHCETYQRTFNIHHCHSEEELDEEEEEEGRVQVLGEAETLAAGAGRELKMRQTRSQARPLLQAAAAGAVQQATAPPPPTDALRYADMWTEKHYPLKEDGADLGDVREAFGFSASWSTHSMNAQQTGNGAVKKNATALSRQASALNDVAAPIARMLAKRKGAGSSEEVLERWHAREAGTQREDATATAVRSNLIDAVEATDPTSPEGKTARAVLCAQGLPEDVDAVKLQLPSKRAAVGHLNELLESGEIPTGEGRTVQRVSDEVIIDAVAFLMEDRNTSMYSWGFKKVKIGDDWVQIECLSRKRTKAAMWLDYDALHPAGTKRLGRASFYTVVKALTGKQVKSVAAVDYVVAETLNANQARMRKLILGEINDSAIQKALLKEMEQVFRWVKNTYPTKIDTEECPSLSSGHAMGEAGKEIAGGKITNEDSAAVFLWFDKLSSHINPMWHQLITEAVEKVQIAMAHSVRAAVQQRRIREIEKDLEKRGSNHCKIILDYKMKLTPCQWRESTILHYGKRGISFHGAVLAFRNDADEIELHYLDTVVDGDAKQNVGATFAIVEDLLKRVKAILPRRIKTFTFQVHLGKNHVHSVCCPHPPCTER